MKDKVSIEHSSEGDVLIVNINGCVTASNTASFQSRLKELINFEQSAIVLDGEKLEFISSAGLRSILKTAKDALEQNKSLSICSLNPNVQKIFEISGFNKIIAIYADRQKALSAISQASP